MTTASRDDLVQLLDAPLAAVGLDLEEIDLSSAGKRRVLRVAVDKDGGVSMDDVADATREVSRVLDETDAMGSTPYTLEVGSPGVDRLLTLPRHWRRNRDRLVKATVTAVDGTGGETLTGRVLASDETTATLDVSGRERVVRLADVAKARVQVEFTRPTTSPETSPEISPEISKDD